MRNYKEHRLSKTDQQIMDFFWDSGKKEIMARDVLQYFYAHGKTWNQQNVANYLKNLQKIGMLRAEVRNGKYFYYPTMSREDYRLLPTRKVIEEDYKGSYGDFVMALIEDTNNKDGEIDKLRNILENYAKSLSDKDSRT